MHAQNKARSAYPCKDNDGKLAMSAHAKKRATKFPILAPSWKSSSLVGSRHELGAKIPKFCAKLGLALPSSGSRRELGGKIPNFGGKLGLAPSLVIKNLEPLINAACRTLRPRIGP